MVQRLKISSPLWLLLGISALVGSCSRVKPKPPVSAAASKVTADSRTEAESTAAPPERERIAPRVLYVSSRGKPGGDGKKRSPLPSIAEALAKGATKIVLTENGAYQWPTDKERRDFGAIVGRGPKTIIRDFGGSPVQFVSLESLGVQVHKKGAHFGRGGKARFQSVQVQCRNQCLRGEETELVLVQSRIRAGRAQQALKFRGSEVSLAEVSIQGGKAAALQIESGKLLADRLSVRTSGSGVVLLKVRARGANRGAALRGSTIKARQAAVLSQDADVLVDQGYFQGKKLAAFAITGDSRVTVRDADLAAGPEGGVFMGPAENRLPALLMEDSTLSHRRYSGAKIAGGTARFQRVIFEGQKGRLRKGGESILAHGDAATVHVQESVFQYPVGSAVSVTDGASLAFNGEVIGSGGSALLLVDAGSPTQIRAKISRCRAGYGIEVSKTEGVEVLDSMIERCPEGGMLLTDKSRAIVRRSRLFKNGRRNLGVYGFSEAQVVSSTISGSRWAVFSSCGDGAVSRIRLSKVEGQTSECR